MRKLMILVLFTLFVSHPSFARQPSSMPPDEAKSPACEAIARACLHAGYTRRGMSDRAFWHSCMKPVLFGEHVRGVHVHSSVIKACRKFKIHNLQEQLEQFRQSRNR